jgi:hypothetical protein
MFESLREQATADFFRGGSTNKSGSTSKYLQPTLSVAAWPLSPASQAQKSFLTGEPHAHAWGYMLSPVTQAG